MRKIRAGLVAVVAVGLLAGLTVGVLAQDEIEQSAEPFTSFRAKIVGPPASISLDPQTGNETLRVRFQASDPRLTGALDLVAARGGTASAPGSATLTDGLPRYDYSKYGARIDNDGGSWVGTMLSFEVAERDERTRQQKKQGKGVAPIRGRGGLLEFSGEGGYDGLTMVATFGADGIFGVIMPTDAVPTQPEPPAPPAG